MPDTLSTHCHRGYSSMVPVAVNAVFYIEVVTFSVTNTLLLLILEFVCPK
jgi:hypothetical protein